MAEIAILILENPWDMPSGGTRRRSVLPFFEGLEKLHEHIAVYYSTFHDLAGVKSALDFDLLQTKEPRQILYIGSHGGGGQVANFKLSSLREAIRRRAEKIEGVIISSCEVCHDPAELEYLLEDTGIRWAMGYRGSVKWFDSTMLELTLLNALAHQDLSYRKSQASIEDFFKQALRLIRPDHNLLTRGRGSVADNLTIVTQFRRGSTLKQIRMQ